MSRQAPNPPHDPMFGHKGDAGTGQRHRGKERCMAIAQQKRPQRQLSVQFMIAIKIDPPERKDEDDPGQPGHSGMDCDGGR